MPTNTGKKQSWITWLLPMIAMLGVFILLFSSQDMDNTLQKWVYCGGFALLVAALFYQFLITLSADHSSVDQKLPGWVVPVGAGLLGLFCMILAYTTVGMWPLGSKTTMTVDMHHQYAPLLAGLRSWILGGRLDFYNFEVGLGADFASLFGYYLASPLNLLLVFFPERLLPEGILTILLVKSFLTGAFCGLFLSKVYHKQDASVYVISACYTLMMYCVAYAWNHMWMDVIMLLPLVLYGLERLLKEGKYTLYILTLALALISNYYIAFMLCIFLVFYFFWTIIREEKYASEYGVSFLRFLIGSITGGFLAMGLLIPVYLALQHTSAAGGTLPELTSNFAFFELLGQSLVGATPTIRSGNLPNIYCGTLAVLLLPIFLTTKQIPMRRRLGLLGLWGLMAVSFTINQLDMVWHGLHAPNDLPYRFSFLYSFVLLLIAFETLQVIDRIKPLQIGLSGGILMTFVFFEEQFGEKTLSVYTVYGTLLLVVLYGLIMLLGVKKRLQKASVLALVLLICCCELVVSEGSAFQSLNQNEIFTDHQYYVDNDTTTLLHQAVDGTKELADKEMNGDFYRMEFAPRRTCVDTALFHYRGISNFSSANYYSTTRCMGAFGYEINGVNSHLFRSFSPITDSILGVRYLLLDEAVSDSAYPALKTYQKDDLSYTLYRNPDALPLGFVTSKKMSGWAYSYYDPIETINSWYAAATGEEKPVLEVMDVQAAQDQEQLTVNGGGSFSLNGTGAISGLMQVELKENARIYLFADCRAAESITLDFNDTSTQITPNDPHLIYAGSCKAGETISMSVSAKDNVTGNFYVATLNEDVYQKALAKLKAQGLKVTDFSNSKITGTMDVTTAGEAFTSIPYDAGWQVTVDGKKTTTMAVGESFLGFQITAGKHDVVLRYRPRGWMAGLLLSLLALVLLVTLWLLGRKGRLFTQRLAHQLQEKPEQASQNNTPATSEDDLLPMPEDFWEELPPTSASDHAEQTTDPDVLQPDQEHLDSTSDITMDLTDNDLSNPGSTQTGEDENGTGLADQ